MTGVDWLILVLYMAGTLVLGLWLALLSVWSIMEAGRFRGGDTHPCLAFDDYCPWPDGKACWCAQSPAYVVAGIVMILLGCWYFDSASTWCLSLYWWRSVGWLHLAATPHGSSSSDFIFR